MAMRKYRFKTTFCIFPILLILFSHEIQIQKEEIMINKETHIIPLKQSENKLTAFICKANPTLQKWRKKTK